MSIGYDKFRNINKEFCEQLPSHSTVPSSSRSKYSDLTRGVERYSKSKRSNMISSSPRLGKVYCFSNHHTGRDLLYTMVSVVNERSTFTEGRYFYFEIDSNSTPDVALLANPTQRQPGNGVIVSSADDCRPKSWDFLMSRIDNQNTKLFSRFFMNFMNQSICTEGPENTEGYFTEIASLLLFEIARRLVKERPSRFLQHKERLDVVPVASCIAICLGDKVNDIRKCRDVFGHRNDGNYPKKIRIREEAALAILKRNNGRDNYTYLMKELFSPENDIPHITQRYTKLNLFGYLTGRGEILEHVAAFGSV